MGHANSLNSDLVSNIKNSAVSIRPLQVSDTEIILTRKDARVITGENTVIHSNKFMIDSVEVEIFTNSSSTEPPAKSADGVTIAELVDALHYLDMKPDRIIHFLQSAVSAGLIQGRLLFK